MTTTTEAPPIWEVRPLTELPPPLSPLSAAIRNLGAEQTLLIQASSRKVQGAMTGVRKKYPDRRYRYRSSPDGIWLWWEPRDEA